MAKLKTEHKRLIVQRLATFASPSEIQAELKALGVIASASQIVYYDPSGRNPDLAVEWRKLHADTRAQFVKDTAAIPIANKSFRLSRLDAMARAAETKKNYPLAAQLLEQAAKEMGEAYTNRRVIESADPMAALAGMLGVSADDIAGALAGVGESET